MVNKINIIVICIIAKKARNYIYRACNAVDRKNSGYDLKIYYEIC